MSVVRWGTTVYACARLIVHGPIVLSLLALPFRATVSPICNGIYGFNYAVRFVAAAIWFFMASLMAQQFPNSTPQSQGWPYLSKHYASRRTLPSLYAGRSDGPLP